MRVKLLLALAIAGLILLCSTGVALAMNPACGAGCDCGSGCKCTDNCDCNSGNPNARCDCAHNSGATTSIPSSVTGVPTAAQLTSAADNDIAAFGFPDLSGVEAANMAVGVPADTIEATTLDSPICGVCGQCPPCSCEETTTIIPGPQVNLGCPLLTVCPTPVNLVSPVITPVFPAINVAPQAIVAVPQVNAQLNCFDIACQPVTNINQCLPCPTQKPKVC